MLLYGSNRLTVREGLQALFRRRLLVLSVFVLTVVPIAVATFTTPKTYFARAKILMLRNDNPGSVRPYAPRLSQDEEVKSELEIATSRPVLEEVLRMQLTEDNVFEDYQTYARGNTDELVGSGVKSGIQSDQ